MESQIPRPAELRASEAARVLGCGITAFNAKRRAFTRALNPQTGALTDPPSDDGELRKAILVAPALGGHRLPGSDWVYDRAQVEILRVMGKARASENVTEWVRKLATTLAGGSGEVPQGPRGPRRGSQAPGRQKPAGAGV